MFRLGSKLQIYHLQSFHGKLTYHLDSSCEFWAYDVYKFCEYLMDCLRCTCIISISCSFFYFFSFFCPFRSQLGVWKWKLDGTWWSLEMLAIDLAFDLMMFRMFFIFFWNEKTINVSLMIEYRIISSYPKSTPNFWWTNYNYYTDYGVNE